MDLQKTVLFKYTYIRPVQAAIAIRRSRKICQKGEYLDCCCEHFKVMEMTQAFAQAFNNPNLADPDIFLQSVDNAIREKMHD